MILFIFPYHVSSFISCILKGRLIVKSSLSVALQTAKVQIGFFDEDDVIILYTNEIEINQVDPQVMDGSRYLGETLVIYNDCGAKKIKIKLTAPPTSGNISCWAAGV